MRREGAEQGSAAAGTRRGKKSGADLAYEVLQHFAAAARAFLTACAKVGLLWWSISHASNASCALSAGPYSAFLLGSFMLKATVLHLAHAVVE